MNLVRVVIAGCRDPAEDFAQLRFVIHQLQQGSAARPVAADAKNVLGRRVEVGDKQIVVQQNDAGVQAVENFAGVGAEWAVARTSAF
jgi:hypothetical protein